MGKHFQEATITFEKAVEPTTKTPTIGLWGGVSTIVSLMIGSGIFTYAGEIHKQVQSTSLALGTWLLAGCLALAGALCYAELGTMIPGSGGEAQYLMRGFGPLMTYLFDWTSILILKPGTVAIMSLAFSQHVIAAYGLLMESGYESSSATGTSVLLVAILGCFLVTVLSTLPRLCNRILNALTFSKIAALMFIICGGLWYGQFTEAGRAALRSNFQDHWTSKSSDSTATLTVGAFVTALCEGLWGFEGWNNLNIVAGDVMHPEKNLPLAIWISVGGVLCLYVMALLGYYCILPHDDFSGTATAGIAVGERVFAAALGVKAAKFGGALMACLVLGSTFSAALSSMFTSAEIITLSARSGRIPGFFHTNVRAYWMQGLLASAMILGFSKDLVTVYTFPTWIFYALCTIVLLTMRLWEPLLERPYRVHTSAPIFFMIACVLLIGTTIVGAFWQVAASLTIMAIGIPFYYYCVRGGNDIAK